MSLLGYKVFSASLRIMKRKNIHLLDKKYVIDVLYDTNRRKKDLLNYHHTLFFQGVLSSYIMEKSYGKLDRFNPIYNVRSLCLCSLNYHAEKFAKI